MRRSMSMPLFVYILPIVILAGWFAAALALDQRGARAPEGRFDLLIVAGCRVQPNGQPSLALQRRVDHALRLYAEGRAPRVLFTGGVGDFPPSEAEAAAAYAIARGLPASAALREDRSTSTEENAAYAAQLAGSLQLPAERVLVVTDAYHTFRARRVFARHFAEVEATGSRPAARVRVRGALREVLAVAGYLVAGRL